MFNVEDLKHITILSDIIKKHKKRINKNNKELFLRQIIRDIINEMVKDIIKNTRNNLYRYKIKSIKDVYKAKNEIVCFSDNMKLFDTSIKIFLKENMYFSKEVLKKTNQGKMIIKFLFSKIRKNPKKYINNKFLNKMSYERIVSDFIAGMTDRYAINLYKQLK